MKTIKPRCQITRELKQFSENVRAMQDELVETGDMNDAFKELFNGAVNDLAFTEGEIFYHIHADNKEMVTIPLAKFQVLFDLSRKMNEFVSAYTTNRGNDD